MQDFSQPLTPPSPAFSLHINPDSVISYSWLLFFPFFQLLGRQYLATVCGPKYNDIFLLPTLGMANRPNYNYLFRTFQKNCSCFFFKKIIILAKKIFLTYYLIGGVIEILFTHNLKLWNLVVWNHTC